MRYYWIMVANKKMVQTHTDLTPEELKSQCPDGYDDLIASYEDDPENCSPVEELEIWKTEDEEDTQFWIQDPLDVGFRILWTSDSPMSPSCGMETCGGERLEVNFKKCKVTREKGITGS